MPNCSPMAFRLPNTATRSFVFMSQELSTLRNGLSRTLSSGLVKLPYMGGTTLQQRLVEIADALGSDAELARIAKVSRSAVSQWRDGQVKSLQAESALNIQERTGWSARWLVLGIGPKKLGSRHDVGALTHDTHHVLSPPNEKKLLVVLRAFLETDDEGKNQIVEAVSAVAGENGGSGQKQERAPSKSRRGGSTR